MRTLKITIAYDGTDFEGWQSQPSGKTVQQAVERGWEKLTAETVRVTSSGRTDAGVHALGQVISCTTNCQLPTDIIRRALDANLSRDIVVLDVQEADPGFHAIRDAISKRYRYVLQDGQHLDVFARRYCWFVPGKLHDAAMHRAAQAMRGTHDFSSFQTSGSERASTVRTVTDFSVERRTAELAEKIVIEVAADGFLYNMVRTMVGTLVEVGRGARPESWVTEVLEARDRRQAGMTAPPQGLFLVEVDYG